MTDLSVDKLFSLHGTCAVIIGGAGKIGFPMAQALGEAGAGVVIASRSAKNYDPAVKILKSSGIDAIGVRLDQGNEDSVKNCIQVAFDHFNRPPNILINCGVERPMEKFFDDTVDNWDKSMVSNARGLFVTCREFARSMSANGGGSIINVASIYGVVAPDPALYLGTSFETEPDYPYTKGGMVMFSKYLASKFAKKNVRVNVIAPGGFFNNQGEPFLTQYCNKVPMGRMANHNDMKGPAVFLASQASSYITGAVLSVDGGFTII